MHELITAWEDDEITGADAIHALQAMLGGWVPGTARANPGASGGSTPPPSATEREDGPEGSEHAVSDRPVEELRIVLRAVLVLVAAALMLGALFG